MSVEYKTCTLEQLATLEKNTIQHKVKVTGSPMWVEFGRQSALILEDKDQLLLCRFPEFDRHYPEKSPGPVMRAIIQATTRQNAIGTANPVTVYGEYWVATQHSIEGIIVAGGVLDVDGLHTREYALSLRTETHRDELMKLMRASMDERQRGKR